MAAPLVLAHRGASGYLPDHTLEAYALAISQGADVIEPDLVSTRDGHLIARHENELSSSTDVAVRFPDRWTHKVIDGKALDGWFSEDFTLAEIRTLRARQPMTGRPTDHDGKYGVPTFDEILAFVKAMEAQHGRRIGIEPETKHPSYFQGEGLPLEPSLVKSLVAYGYDGPEDPVVVQSFEEANLRTLRTLTTVRLLRLVDEPGDLLSIDGLAGIRSYAEVVGLHKSHLVADDGTDTGVLARVRAVGLEVHVYTFRNEPSAVAPWASGDPQAELRRYYAMGVDGVFADFPDTAVAARAAP